MRQAALMFLLLVTISCAPTARMPEPEPGNGDLVTEPQQGAEPVQVDPTLSQGYSLLHGLMSQQANVDKILILKSASDPVKTLIRAIAARSSEARDRLAELVRVDPALQLQTQALPAIEQDARQRIESATTKALLGTGGAAFQTRLLLTQQSATEYAAALADSLAKRDQDPRRRLYLQDLARQFDDLHRQVLAELKAAR